MSSCIIAGSLFSIINIVFALKGIAIASCRSLSNHRDDSHGELLRYSRLSCVFALLSVIPSLVLFLQFDHLSQTGRFISGFLYVFLTARVFVCAFILFPEDSNSRNSLR